MARLLATAVPRLSSKLHVSCLSFNPFSHWFLPYVRVVRWTDPSAYVPKHSTLCHMTRTSPIYSIHSQFTRNTAPEMPLQVANSLFSQETSPIRRYILNHYLGKLTC